jgi:hypothetical protein
MHLIAVPSRTRGFRGGSRRNVMTAKAALELASTRDRALRPSRAPFHEQEKHKKYT